MERGVVDPDKCNRFNEMQCAAFDFGLVTIASCTLYRDSHKRIIDKLCHDFGSTLRQRETMLLHPSPREKERDRTERERERERSRFYTPFLF